MFVDKVSVEIRAGDGGNGAVSFRQEKFIDRGGPDGGDGGNGGSVILVASNNENTLAAFRYSKELAAKPGADGSKRKKHGRSGKPLYVMVPVGTVATTTEGKVLADLTEDGQEVVVAKGGKGGFGNAHFISSRRQAPKFAEKGEAGDKYSVVLELKMIADIGLVGLPNAGKSTLLSRVSNARPEIADYPFTTLTPNLGVVDVGDASLLIADIPGLIEGAAKGKGLGHDFLRHVERTAVLLHLIDIYNEDLVRAYKVIRTELKNHDKSLAARRELVVLTKIEGLDDAMVEERIEELRSHVSKDAEIYAISATSGKGLDELKYTMKRAVDEVRAAEAELAAEEDGAAQIPVISLDTDEDAWTVEKVDDYFQVRGKKIETFAARTDFSNEEAVQRLRDIMKKIGITHELLRCGIQADQVIRIGDKAKLTF